MEEKIKKYLREAAKKAYNADVDNVFLEHPENLEFGDYATNLPLIMAREYKQPPQEIAKNIVYELKESAPFFEVDGKKHQIFKKIEFAPPGFINLTLSDEWIKYVLFLITQSEQIYGIKENYKGNKVIIEYTDPNPFKVFHIGHTMTNTIGESLSKIFEILGADVKRANYQGDVGVHVAKAIWGLLKKVEEENLRISDLEKINLRDRVYFIGQAYAVGNTAYENEDSAKKEIDLLNRVVYFAAQKCNQELYDWQPIIDYEEFIKDIKGDFNLDLIANLYKFGRTWSLDYFETIYQRLGTKFDFYYLESMIGEEGLQVVKDNKDVFEKSEGAIVFRGEDHGLHTRVFINSQGLPVYEAKDLGLALKKYEDFAYDKSIIVTGNDVNEYFKVILKALDEINPDLARKTTHIGHGMMNLKTGKMSSRTGDVVSGDELLDDIQSQILEKMENSETTQVGGVEEKEEIAGKVAVAALKYSILKSGIGNNILYDNEEAISLQGNTGPYLLYTYARTNSLLEKYAKIGAGQSLLEQKFALEGELEDLEQDILRHLYKFSEEISLAAERLSPNLIASFIYNTAKKYNSLYAGLPIINAESDDKVNLRLHITKATNTILKNGLNLLGIRVVDKM